MGVTRLDQRVIFSCLQREKERRAGNTFSKLILSIADRDDQATYEKLTQVSALGAMWGTARLQKHPSYPTKRDLRLHCECQLYALITSEKVAIIVR